ncbi:8902_t:CDS:10 [Entrophospora sp. SA101]|nr:8902_t:CDS:10 [Entrophospora sp. SA101]
MQLEVKNTSSTTSTFSSNTFSIYFRTARNLSSIVEHLIKNEIESLQSFLEEKDRVQLSSEQTKIYDLVVHENSNVFFTGAAGTGKSLLLRVLIKALKQKHEKISYDKDSIGVTATTGIAAINIGGKTLHSFTGIGRCPDHYNVHGLVRKIDGSISASTRWNNVKVLIIDEISMLDAELFDKLNSVAKILRKNDNPFGGIQLVLSGDFCQLPPIGEETKYCFEADSWSDYLVNMLNELRFGTVTGETKKIMKSLEKERVYPDDGIAVSELYPCNKSVDEINLRKLEEIPHKKYEYLASDSKSSSDVQELLKKNCMAKKTLELKRGAQVMLIKNLPKDNLVNGSKGVVVGFYAVQKNKKFYSGEDESFNGDILLPIVKFTNGVEKIIYVSKWRVEDSNGKLLALRHQLPLILSWAISIHKSQGQSFERIKVDLKDVFEKGQTYVALSRAVSLESIQVLNFSQRKIMSDPKVVEFYKSLLKYNEKSDSLCTIDYDKDGQEDLDNVFGQLAF